MAHIIANRVTETSTSSGTGDLTLTASGASRRFGDRMAVNDTCFYLAEQRTAGVVTAWEIGKGTYKGNNVLGRTTVLESTNGNNAVSFDGSAKTITMASVAPSAATAAELRTALGVTAALDDLNNAAAVQLLNTITAQLGTNITRAGF